MAPSARSRRLWAARRSRSKGTSAWDRPAKQHRLEKTETTANGKSNTPLLHTVVPVSLAASQADESQKSERPRSSVANFVAVKALWSTTPVQFGWRSLRAEVKSTDARRHFPFEASVAPTDASKRIWFARVGHIDLEHFPAPGQAARECQTEAGKESFRRAIDRVCGCFSSAEPQRLGATDRVLPCAARWLRCPFSVARNGRTGRRPIDEFRSGTGCWGAQFGSIPSIAGRFQPDFQEVWDFLGARRRLRRPQSLLDSGLRRFGRLPGHSKNAQEL